MTEPEAPPAFDPVKILGILNRHKVDYVLIGGLASILHGSPIQTNDADVCPSREAANLDRLALALEEMEALVFASGVEGGLKWAADAGQLSRAEMWNLLTPYGRFDISFAPAGTGGYEDLRKDAVTYSFHGAQILVASLRDVIRSKEAAGRDRDRLHLPTLRKLLDRLEDK